jgi:hypothetical protein
MTLSGVLIVCGLILSGCGQHYEEGSHPPPKPLPPNVLPVGHPSLKFAHSLKLNTAGKGAISGVVRLSSALITRVPGNAYLYLIARERADGGPPYLLKKIRVPDFPYEFTMDQGDVGQMFGEGIVLSEIPEMYLIARIDQDGMAMPQPGDLEGTCLQNPIAGGAQNLEIVIDRAY